MLNLSRLLVLLAVALVAARPAMACCLAGHDEPAAATIVETEALPCHGEATKAAVETTRTDHEPTSPKYCPGCLDCDAVAMQVQSVDAAALLSQISSEIPLAIAASDFSGFEHSPIVFKTGPPGDAPIVGQTPITLKQRLLI